MIEPDTTQRTIKVDVSVDTGWIAVVLLFIAALSWGLGTLPGNRFMCNQSWAPVYIDCEKVAANGR